MVAPGMLENPTVMKWLGGVEPAWTLLDQSSFNALHQPPSPGNGPIHLAADLMPSELQQSAIARNTLHLLRAAATEPGLKLTATGNLARSVVMSMVDIFTWPEFKKADLLRFNKVVNEPDFHALFFIRHLVHAAKLVRKNGAFLQATPAGRKLLDERHQKALQAVLFHITLWHLDMGYGARGLHPGWPQRDVGVVLWSLSVAATGWQSPERLTRLCTIPIIGVLEATWDSGSSAMEGRILRPLYWFGLLEHKEEPVEGNRFAKRHFYRKTALFDRFISFDVTIEQTDGPRH